MSRAAPLRVWWVNDLPQPGRRPTVSHDRLAEILRTRPGEWAEVPDLNPNCSTVINHGGRDCYQPAGTFQATVRGGALYARYVGNPHKENHTP